MKRYIIKNADGSEQSEMQAIHASDFKCVECGKQAEVLFPVMDPDIPSYPYCKKCADKAQRELFIKLCEI